MIGTQVFDHKHVTHKKLLQDSRSKYFKVGLTALPTTICFPSIFCQLDLFWLQIKMRLLSIHIERKLQMGIVLMKSRGPTLTFTARPTVFPTLKKSVWKLCPKKMIIYIWMLSRRWTFIIGNWIHKTRSGGLQGSTYRLEHVVKWHGWWMWLVYKDILQQQPLM